MKRSSIAAGVAALSLAACSGAVGTDTTESVDLTPDTLTPATTLAPDPTPETPPDTTAETVGDTSTTSMDSDAGGMSGDVEQLLADLQGQFVEFGSELEASGAADELNQAWTESQTVLLEALTAIQSGELIDMATVESALDDFEQAVPTTETELMAAWEELRSTLEVAIERANAG
jgi:hypothetical protein